MNTALPLHLRILAEDKNSIAYRPVFAKITGSVLGAILLQQVLYRFDTNGGKAFYKFMQPCRHKLYKHGDSWLEELGFSRYEMAAALKAIGTKSTAGATKKELMAVDIPQFNSKGVLENATSLLIYWTDSSRVTWFWLNAVLLGNAVSQHYLGNAAKQIYLDKSEQQQYLVNPQSNITLNTENTPKITTENKTRRSARVVAKASKTLQLKQEKLDKYDATLQKLCRKFKPDVDWTMIRPRDMYEKELERYIDAAEIFESFGLTADDLPGMFKYLDAKGWPSYGIGKIAECAPDYAGYKARQGAAKKIIQDNPALDLSTPVEVVPILMQREKIVSAAELVEDAS